MIRPILRLTAAAAALALAGCVSMPSGPAVMALPGTGKPFEQFRADDGQCREYAAGQSGGGAQAAAADSVARSAVVGTVIGAAAGAAVGGSGGAGVGAGAGLLMGAAAGSNTGTVSAVAAQRRYDTAYLQCMYSMGHRVPAYGRFIGAPAARPAPAAAQALPPGYVPATSSGSVGPSLPPPGMAIPPPPPGPPPPPPPGVRPN